MTETNINSSDNEQLRIKLNLVYNDIYNEIGFLPSTNVPYSTKTGRIKLWDIFVPLRSDIEVNIEIKENKLFKIELTTSSGYLLGDCTSDKVNTLSSNISKDFLPLVFSRIESLIANKSSKIPGLSLSSRPLVASPIWTDGINTKLGILEVSSALNVYNKVVLLGLPGSGKSTIAKTIACSHMADIVYPNDKEINNKIGIWEDSKNKLKPIFIEVKRLVSSTYFPDIESEITVKHYFDYLKNEILNNDVDLFNYFLTVLSNGTGILIFDGLDEITISDKIPDALDKRREQIQNLMHSLSRQFPHCKIIVTSRPAGYSGWTLEGFDTIYIKPVNNSESISIINSLYKSFGIDIKSAKERASILSQHLNRIPKSLREQPLFVVLLAMLYFDNQKKELPVERGALLKHSIELLISSWSIKRTGVDDITELLGCAEDQLIDILEVIAFKSLDSEISSSCIDEPYIPRHLILDELFELGASVNFTKVLSYISENAGILTSPATRNYKFAHRLFQEYLAASWLSKTKDFVQTIISLLDKSFHTWQEVALLLADLLSDINRKSDIWDLIESLSESKNSDFIWLSGKIIKEQNLSIEKRKSIIAIADQLRRNFIEVLENQKVPVLKRIDIAISLDIIGDYRTGVGLKDENIPDIHWCEIPTSTVIIGATPEQINILIENGAGDWHFKRETPAFEIEIKKFKISLYPITIIQFQSFVEDDEGYYNDRWWSKKGIEWRNHNSPPVPSELSSNCPQNYVTWYESNAFCNWMSFKLKKQIRLPSEIEWEASAKRHQNTIYPWGNSFKNNLANTRELGLYKIIPVGCLDNINVSDGIIEFPKEMIGNIWEWCSTIVEIIDGEKYNYPYNATDGRENNESEENNMRATRGGFYMSEYIMTRSSYRGRDIEAAKLARQGFRIVMEI